MAKRKETQARPASDKQPIGWKTNPNYIRVPNTILVLNGTPYGLFRQKDVKVYCPCDLCDLRYICETTEGRADFAPLCWPEEEDQKSFFQEDWQLVNKKVRSFCDNDEVKFWLGEIWEDNEKKNVSSRNRSSKRESGFRNGRKPKRGKGSDR